MRRSMSDGATARVFYGAVDQDVMSADDSLAIPRGSSVELIVRSISNQDLVIDLASVTVNGQKVRVNSVCGWHRRRAAGRFWEECADRGISGAAEDCGHHNWRDCGRGKGCCHRRSRGGGSVSWHAIPYPGQERK